MEGDASVAELKKLASEQGMLLTDDDLAPVETTSELSDDELEAVAGGGTCACTGLGGGRKDKGSDEKPCGCVAAGFGKDEYGKLRCTCVAMGLGD